MSEKLEQFYERFRGISDILLAQQAIEWDQQVLMPRKGAEQRSHQVAALAGVAHGRLTDKSLEDLLSSLESGNGLDEAARADLREARRARDRAARLPGRLVSERAKACALAQAAWQDARPRNDFAAFLPHLERVLALTREAAAALSEGNAYDALLEEYEPGMTEAELTLIFDDLKGRLLPLLDAIKGAPRRPDASLLRRHYPREQQEIFCRQIIADMGFDFEAGRLDVSAHPFTSGTSRDVRLTTRYLEDFLPAGLFGSLHEAGHGLYEQGLDPTRFRDPAGQACSLGVHESQSRFWENVVGRSCAFWSHYLEPLKRAFPGTLDDVGLDAFYGAVNTVSPSLIRVEADECTYNLHIMMRFELESALISGALEARDLPSAWNEKMGRYLGIRPPDDRDGVLQDVHWSVGLIGYFPTYTLGNLYSGQFREALLHDMPDLNARLARGDFQPVKEWLREKIHRHGRRWLAQDLCLKVTGTPLTAEPLMRYLKAKYAEVYGI